MRKLYRVVSNVTRRAEIQGRKLKLFVVYDKAKEQRKATWRPILPMLCHSHKHACLVAEAYIMSGLHGAFKAANVQVPKNRSKKMPDQLSFMEMFL